MALPQAPQQGDRATAMAFNFFIVLIGLSFLLAIGYLISLY